MLKRIALLILVVSASACATHRPPPAEVKMTLIGTVRGGVARPDGNPGGWLLHPQQGGKDLVVLAKDGSWVSEDRKFYELMTDRYNTEKWVTVTGWVGARTAGQTIPSFDYIRVETIEDGAKY